MILKKLIDFLLETSNCEDLVTYLRRITEIGRVGIVVHGDNEFIITIKGRYHVIDTRDGTTRKTDTIFVYSTTEGLICWRTEKNRWEEYYEGK